MTRCEPRCPLPVPLSTSGAAWFSACAVTAAAEGAPRGRGGPRAERGGGGAGRAMWFLYGLSWLSLLLQVAFVTLAIGERRRGGPGGAVRPRGP